MITLDFKCKKCGCVFEELVRRDEGNPACIKCGSLKTERIFSPGTPLHSKTEQSRMCMRDLPKEVQKEKKWANWMGVE